MLTDSEAAQAVRDAVAMGYRHIDTAQAYGNEAGVGEGIRTCGISRDELFVTSKVAAENKSYDSAAQSIDETLRKTGLDYIDMMIIHSPQPWAEFRGEKRCFEENREVWRALEDAYKAGKVRAIGVSNFLEDDLENILNSCGIKPMVNQILAHISNTPLSLIDFCNKNGIQTEAYSPIAHGEALNHIGEGLSLAVDDRMKSERMKTELITNVSHDLKTPLTSIVNYVDLLEKEDICVMNAAGEQIGGRGRRSSEYLLHEAVYQARPDVTAVVHSHCPFLTAYALRYQNFDVPETCSLREVFTHFTCLPYGKPGTHEIHRGIGEALADSPICLLGGHGVVCASTSLERCIGLLEAAEGLAKTIWLAK